MNRPQASVITPRGVAATLLLAVLAAASLAASASVAENPIAFTDVKKQTAEFMRYNREIELSKAQESIKREALEALPAACCSDNSAYTCCCPCNLSRSIWGLSNRLITEHGYNAQQVRTKVQEWIAFINPGGFSGDGCYTGGCGRPFSKNGCGGMVEGRVSWPKV